MLSRHQLGEIVVDSGGSFWIADFPAGRMRVAGEPAPEAFPTLRTTAGLVDLQVNGFAGIDFNDPALTPDRLDHALESMLATGVTTCLPTIITAAPGEIEKRFLALDRAVAESRLGRWMVPGYHLEGPHLNPASGYAGCHPPEAMTRPNWPQVLALEEQMQRPILLVTLAPEIEGAIAFVHLAAAAGKLVAIGHSAADVETVRQAVEAGAAMSTHLGNGLPQTLPKLNNTLFAQLAEERLFASFIADGIHLPDFAAKAMMGAKGLTRSVLVTDAVSAAASPPGLYRFAGMDVERSTDGVVRQPSEAHLAGSALCLDQALRNVVAWGICSWREALSMACHQPRQLLAASLQRHGAPLSVSAVRWTEDLQVAFAAVGPWSWGAVP